MCARLEPSAANALEALAGTYDTSYANVLLAAWQSLLARLTGQSEIVTKVFFDGREFEELSGALGLIGEMLPIGTRFVSDFRFRDVLESLRDAVFQAAEWQAYYAPSDEAAGVPSVDFDYAGSVGEQVYGDVGFRIDRQEAWSERFELKLSARRREEE